jgi:hypothetical protein
MPSNKSTQEDIEKKAKEALEAKENEDKETPEGEEETEAPEDEQDSPTDNEDDENPEDEETDEGEGEGEEGEDEGEEGKKFTTPPVEERFKHQQRENQVLYSKQKKFTETVEQAASLPEPTEEELKVEFPDWDTMTETEQRLAKRSLMSDKRFSMVHGAVQEGKKIDEWNEKVDQFLVTAVTTFPRMAGKENEFKSFCMKPTRRGVDLEDLANAFLNTATETPAPRKKGSLLETGSGAKGDRPKGDFIDERHAAALRTKNHKEYNRLVKAGKIKIQI